MSFQRLESLPCELRTLFYRKNDYDSPTAAAKAFCCQRELVNYYIRKLAGFGFVLSESHSPGAAARSGVSLAAPSSSHFEQDTSYPEALAIAGRLICDLWAHDSSCNGARQAWHAHSCLYFIKVHMAGAAQPRKRSSRIKMPELKLPNVTRPSRG